MKYTEISQECGGQITLTQFANSTVLQSPNHPEIPPPHTECTWAIFGTPGERIKIDFEFMDLTRTINCKNEYVEIRDGGTSSSALIDRYCQYLPSSIFTSDNMAYLKFFTDVEDPRSGFKARISVASCGGTIRAENGIIYYPANSADASVKDCLWHVIGPADHTIALHFNKLQVPCNLGHVTISEFNRISGNQTETAAFCENATDLQTSNNEVFIHYHSSSFEAQNTFSLTFNSTQDSMWLKFFYNVFNNRSILFIDCGALMETGSGVIESPGYPKMNHFHRNCEWDIKVPKGRRITFELLDFDLDESVGMDEQGMAFFDGKDFILMQILRGGNTTRIIESTDNTLVVYFWSSVTSSHRGFRARYTSDKPTRMNFLRFFSLKTLNLYVF